MSSIYYGKKWWQSKTMWINILSVAIIIIQSLTEQNFIPMEVQAPILAIINIFLRSITNKAIVRVGG